MSLVGELGPDLVDQEVLEAAAEPVRAWRDEKPIMTFHMRKWYYH